MVNSKPSGTKLGEVGKKPNNLPREINLNGSHNYIRFPMQNKRLPEAEGPDSPNQKSGVNGSSNTPNFKNKKYSSIALDSPEENSQRSVLDRAVKNTISPK